MDKQIKLIKKIAVIGKDHPSIPLLARVNVFRGYFTASGNIKKYMLNSLDGNCSVKELMLRYLLLCAVLDQGPDITGIRLFVQNVINSLYRNEVRILHTPIKLFSDLGVTIEKINTTHALVKRLRSTEWARRNSTNASRYNLFMDGAKQVLNYTISRWGVPLALPLLLEKESSPTGKRNALYNWLSKQRSAEVMTRNLKDDFKYGLGKAIGDKACHLFAKWTVSTFGILKKDDVMSWGDISYEIPLDSNAGRVLWRTGFIPSMLSRVKLSKHDVIQRGEGKRGTNYLRITNLRGISVDIPNTLKQINRRVVTDYMGINTGVVQTVKFQHVINVLLLKDGLKNGIHEVDDGLIYIGTKYCFNTDRPNCERCPIKMVCNGYRQYNRLIRDYRT